MGDTQKEACGFRTEVMSNPIATELHIAKGRNFGIATSVEGWAAWKIRKSVSPRSRQHSVVSCFLIRIIPKTTLDTLRRAETQMKVV